MSLQFVLPELGENIESADVLDVLVSVGDEIEVDTPVLEIETDKATIEVPSDVAGKVTEIHISAGQTASIGQTILTLAASESSSDQDSSGDDDDSSEAQDSAETTGAAQTAERSSDGAGGEKPKESRATSVVAPRPAPSRAPASNGTSTAPRTLAPAAPSTRRLAREIGVDINQVPGTGPGGRISIGDVKNFAKSLLRDRPKDAPVAASTTAATIAAEPLPDFGQFGEIRREAMSGIRKATSAQMARAWSTIPQVTQFDKADITELEQLRKQMNKKLSDQGVKITVTAILLKILSSALKKFPNFNASIDILNEEIVYKDYQNIGVAVDTERGLLVPVVRDTQLRNIVELAEELGEIAEKARTRKIRPDDLQGACITITNLGGIGGHAFTPIVNPPEVAIVGVSRASTEPVFLEGKFRPRLMMPICVSYDHRLIDGADAARFLRWVCQALESPALLAFEG